MKGLEQVVIEIKRTLPDAVVYEKINGCEDVLVSALRIDVIKYTEDKEILFETLERIAKALEILKDAMKDNVKDYDYEGGVWTCRLIELGFNLGFRRTIQKDGREETERITITGNFSSFCGRTAATMLIEKHRDGGFKLSYTFSGDSIDKLLKWIQKVKEIV